MAAASGAHNPDLPPVLEALQLADARDWRVERAEWDDPYVEFRLLAPDRDLLIDVTYGDGYLDLQIGNRTYVGYLRGPDLAELLIAAIDRRAVAVRRSRLGLTVQEFFDVEGRRFCTDEQILPGAFLRLVPGLADRYDRTPL